MGELEELLSRYGEPTTQEKKTRIMVVDDDPSIGRSLSKVLKEYEVVVSISGVEALEKVSPDIFCVIMDAKMPGMDGFTTSKKIWEKFPNIPIIMHTAFHGEHKTSDVVSYHFFGYVEKGSDLENLKLQVRNACENYANKLKIEEYQHDLERKVEERTVQNKLLLLELSELDKLRFTQQLLAKARHELNNPLTVIRTATDRVDETYKGLTSQERQELSRDSVIFSAWNQVLDSIEKVYTTTESFQPFLNNLKRYNNAILDVLQKKRINENTLQDLHQELGSLCGPQTQGLEENISDSFKTMELFSSTLSQIESESKATEGTSLLRKPWPELNSALSTIKDEVANMSGVINIIAEYAKVGKYSQGNENIELFTFLQNYQTRYKSKFDDSHIQFEIQTDTSHHVRADATQLYEVFDNLINNAIEAGAKHISVHLREKELAGGVTYHEIEIRDNGKGFNPEDKDNMFLPFYSTKGGKLSGIGLGIVKSIVSTNKGFVDCESRPAEGSSFYVTLPPYEVMSP